jgi:hypothetical protein
VERGEPRLVVRGVDVGHRDVPEDVRQHAAKPRPARIPAGLP